MIGRDRLYTQSPEDVIVEREMRNKFENFESKVRDTLLERTRQVYDLHDIGTKQKDIANQLGISQPTVHREIATAKKVMEENFKAWRKTNGE